MTLDLRDLLHSETAALEADVDPLATWTEGARRRRRHVIVSIAGAAGAFALVAMVVTWAALRSDSSATPDPQPAPAQSQTPGVVDGMGTPVQPDQVLSTYDPAEWESLPVYPGDLGSWDSPDTPAALIDDPVGRATAAVQITLGPAQANLFVYGEDGRWRSLDASGLDLVDNGGYHLGLDPGSLSPDGTQLAIGQAEGVVVVDLTNAQSRTYPVEGLGKVWTGRATYWTPDNSAVLLGRSWAALGEPLEYTNGWRIDLSDGSVTRLGFDPTYAALFADGTVIADQWSENGGHAWTRLDPAGSNTPLGELDAYAVHSQPAARNQRWVALRELVIAPSDRPWDGSGILALDDAGRPIAMLPVKGAENNGGGGQIIGWVSDSVALFSMPDIDSPLRSAGVVAWDIDTGKLWRGPRILTDSSVSVAHP